MSHSIHSIGENIRNLRKARNLTQEELAENLGVSSQAVSKWENGMGMPDISMVIPLAHFFGVSADCIFGISEEIESDTIGTIIEEATNSDSFEKEYQILKNALRTYPGDMRLLVELLSCGVMMLSDGDTLEGNERNTIYEECEKAGNLILQYCKEPEIFFNALTWLVRLHCEMDEIEKATSFAEKLPENVSFNKYEGLGRIFSKSEEYQSAAEQFENNVSLFAYSLMHSLIESGNAFVSLNKNREAITLYKTAESIGNEVLKLYPNKKSIEKQLSQCKKSIEVLLKNI